LFNLELYRRRNVVERRVRSLKRYRRIATRSDKLAVNYFAFVQLGITHVLLELVCSNSS
jgi:transposase